MGGTGKPLYDAAGNFIGVGEYTPHLHMYLSRLYDATEKYS